MIFTHVDIQFCAMSGLVKSTVKKYRDIQFFKLDLAPNRWFVSFLGTEEMSDCRINRCVKTRLI